MELELGLKITKTKDDIDSISEYQLMKDTGPIFQSRETNAMFILTAHLKGNLLLSFFLFFIWKLFIGRREV